MKVPYIKIYTRTGTFLTRIDQNLIDEYPSWSEEINTGYNAISISLGYKIDELPTFISPQNMLEVWVTSDEYKTGKLMYKGYIDDISTPASSGMERIILDISPINVIPSRSPFKDGTNYSISYTGSDPQDIVKDIIDDIKTDYPNTIDYSATSIDNVGVSIWMDYVDLIWQDSIEKTFEVVDPNWYFRYDLDSSDRLAYFTMKEYGLVEDYNLQIDSDCVEIEPIKQTKEIINRQVVYYDSGSVAFEDIDSINTYGLHEPPPISDTNIKDNTTALQRATQIVINNKDPKFSGSVVVTQNPDKGLVLEDLKVGQLCKIKGLLEAGSIIQDQLLKIVAIEYRYDTCLISFGEVKDNYMRFFDKYLQYRLNRFI